MRFRRALLSLVLILPLCSRALPRDEGESEWGRGETEALVALAQEYRMLASDSATRGSRDEILARADDIGTIPERRLKEVVKALFQVANRGPKSAGKGECVAEFEKFPGHYYVSGAGGGSKGIFIGLHGGGPGVGDGRTAQSMWGAATGKGLIGVFPTANLDGHAATTWQSPEVENFVLAIVKELKRTFRIDTNRIYVAGHSLGGSGAYHIGLRNADLFAAVSANAGGMHGVTNNATGTTDIPGGFVANLCNTPIFMTHFDRDPRVGVQDARAVAKELNQLREAYPGGYEHRYVEGIGEDHGYPQGTSPGQIIAWMTKHRRDPCPKRVIWEPAAPDKNHFYWLRHAGPVASTSRGSRVVATREGNRFEIEGANTAGISVMLAEGMCDPTMPVTVVVNGEPSFSGVVQRRPAAVLESIMENIDEQQVFAYRIDLEE
jgi:predicted esterase